MSEIACEAGLWYNEPENIVVLGGACDTPSRIHLIGDVPMNTLPPHASNDNPSIPTASGIYKITCTANKKIYIGSSINMRKRKKQHFDKLRLNGHDNPKLQAAWN